MFFKARSVQQVAVLPFVVTTRGIRVLLVTTRDSGTWILPKGWPMGGQSLVDAAASEALEEAGVLGAIDETPVGAYTYRKRMDAGYEVPCHVFVYPMLVHEHRLDWPEQGERQFRWCSLNKAATLVNEPELVEFLSDVRDSGAECLEEIAPELAESPPASTPVDESRGATA